MKSKEKYFIFIWGGKDFVDSSLNSLIILSRLKFVMIHDRDGITPYVWEGGGEKLESGGWLYANLAYLKNVFLRENK